MKVFLLTSHPIAPPWNSGDTNLARTLLLADSGVEFVFVGDRHDPSPWPPQHQRLLVENADHMPSAVDKLRLLLRLSMHSPASDMTHMIVTLQRSRITPNILQRLRVLRRPWIATWPARTFVPLRLLQRASAVAALSEQTAATLRSAGLRRVFHVPPGVDLTRCAPEPVESGWRLLDRGEGPFVLFAGHHDDGGGLVAALDAVARVRRRVPAARLIAAMRHRPGEDPEAARAMLQRLAAERGLRDGVVELNTLANMRAAILASHTVMFQPDRLGLKMDLPLTLVEALAFGRPVVVSRADTLPELGGAPAVRVAGPADDDTVAHITALLTRRDYFDECAAAARELARARYDAAAMVAAYTALYQAAA